ncbi:MAG: GDSL-type esterase/lipase family protein [Lachnospiraceae bacterium]|nr:GDSL-type esterase/lipase family protein [Lachnospiraceae bacterium]
MYDINREAGIVNRGNEERLKAVMRRAAAGDKLTVGFIGGSITNGSLSSTPQTCYAYRVYSWWKETFPKADFTYVNAGIGATDSQYGAARAEEHLLQYKPDVVFIEFSVNDESTEHFLETYEGLVRRVLFNECAPAVILIHNVCYDNGASAQLQHAKVGRHYGLPGVSMQSSIYPELLAGRIPNREITPDDLHPNDAGHELVASVITYYLETVRVKTLAEAGEGNPMEGHIEHAGNGSNCVEQSQNDSKSMVPATDVQPAPLTANTYELSVRYNNRNYTPAEAEGFTADLRPQSDITDSFKNGWEASAQRAHMTFELEGTGVAVQFRRSVRPSAADGTSHFAPIAEVIVDGDPATRKLLDANFDETWGDKLELLTVTEHMPKGIHRVEVRLVEAQDAVVPFYLNAIIMAD